MIDCLVNVMKFSFTTSGSISREVLHEMGIPVLQCYSLLMPEEEWKESTEGMNAMEVSISVSMPEFDGIIHGVPIAAKHVKKTGEVEYLPLKERIAAMQLRPLPGPDFTGREMKTRKLPLFFTTIRLRIPISVVPSALTA